MIKKQSIYIYIALVLLNQEKNLKYYYNMIENSDEMVKATLNKDTKTVCKILKKSKMEKKKNMPTDKINNDNLKMYFGFYIF